jgi:hypothetical protein
MMLVGVASLLSLAPAVARAEEPIKVVQETVDVPAGVDPAAALASVEDIPRIFELYEPAIPWVPGVSIDLEKQVVSAGVPTILAMPVNGNAAGKSIVERANVIATTEVTRCATGEGRKITLSFADSTYNIERRIDRIEIEACLDPADDGSPRITATGRMYAGFKPEDPALNPIMESIGAKAIQGAFIRQVSPIVDAVERHWAVDLPRG